MRWGMFAFWCIGDLALLDRSIYNFFFEVDSEWYLKLPWRLAPQIASTGMTNLHSNKKCTGIERNRAIRWTLPDPPVNMFCCQVAARCPCPESSLVVWHPPHPQARQIASSWIVTSYCFPTETRRHMVGGGSAFLGTLAATSRTVNTGCGFVKNRW